MTERITYRVFPRVEVFGVDGMPIYEGRMPATAITWQDRRCAIRRLLARPLG